MAILGHESEFRLPLIPKTIREFDDLRAKPSSRVTLFVDGHRNLVSMNVFERFGLWSEENAARLDQVLAGLVALIVCPFVLVTYRNMEWFFGLDISGLWSAVFAALMIFPLIWRRTRPVRSAFCVYLAALVHMLIGPSAIMPADLMVLAALYSVTIYGPRWASRVALISSFAGTALFGYLIAREADGKLAPALFLTFTLGLLFLTVWAFANMRRARILSMQTLRDKNRMLEIEREQQVQLGAAAERARIAREMHDIVAHSLSVMIAQADGGRYVAKASPEFAEKALSTIADTGRAALADMRRLLGVLRNDVSEDDIDTLAPQPASGDIESLVDQVRSSGVRVSLVRMGTPRTLPPGAGLTLYRICQESLTNILKHAGPDPTVTIVLSWGRSSLRLEVEDDGRGAASAAASDGQGMGLLGMKERAALFGGNVKAGPKPGGGYRVELELPLPEIPTEEPATPV